ncbi:PEP-CTERM/exosortase system-associated acyltransferase [Neptunomonas antarctica]|uniref:N-acyl amino acid synthase, PEP-CTERM/exosortase system-associated n=1 Tax=Neptunomonas antarctica TaxID=619304 RepID=A0A1N7JF84_9GAMM|nr:PEP-CTERM/exosortase system-associated acyltransferase [Neptunomonas antarctica]SIS47911.1 N-acyl amino acid synthase, PEP-CTERM/exosortase system-associated [Neptunomonas antarctica]
MAISIADNFQKYFSVQFANNKELIDKVYSIRYRVYCEEFGYESLDDFPDDKESDSFDAFSLHCLITHKETGLPAGCVRLVPAGLQTLLPFEEYCFDSLDHEFIDGLNVERQTVCEISRLAVDGAFRRRPHEEKDRFGSVHGFKFAAEEQRVFPLIAVSAFLAAMSLTVLTGRTNVFAMMEPFLPRLLRKSDMHFNRAGNDIDYHGIRAPYFGATQSAVESMRPELKELYDAIHASIGEEYSAYVASK